MLVIPAVEPILRVAPAPKVKSLAITPSSSPVLVIVRSPLFKNVRVVAFWFIVAVPEIVPDPESVKFTLPPGFPMMNVLPDATVNIPVTVIVFPLAEP